MNSKEKTALTRINKIPKFRDVIRKLTIGNPLSEEEKSYVLGCAILFIRHYQSDQRFTSFAEFSYYIVCKYSVHFSDYLPLYDFSSSFGFYPITKTIIENKLIDSLSLQDCCLEIELDRFQNDGYYETLHQSVNKKGLLSDDTLEIGYIAPTSFGKSSVIIDCIKKYPVGEIKVGIIVPTKSLLMQTYRMIRDANLNTKIIIHDEMFSEEASFVAVFTQERALRLLNKKDVNFDLLFIDEAHNILKSDSRSILLARLIRKNRNLNSNQRVIYLSPLLDEINNLRVHADQQIKTFKIPFNIKEPEIYEYKLSGEITKYNRFVGEHYSLGTASDLFTYILTNSGSKNFLYNFRPTNIEKLAEALSARTPLVPQSNELKELIRILKQEVHEKFYAIDYISHGIIYLHGKLPDLIKEYLESKFRDIAEIGYIIANSVILEGMNLPIDTLFIMNTRLLNGKELTNLIGRVNRLNTIFTNQQNNLYKLLPKVHFINSEEYNRKSSNMTGKINLLRSRTFKDYIENPTLESFDFENLKIATDQIESKVKKCKAIQLNETFLNTPSTTSIEKLKHYLIESGICEFYKNVDEITSILSIRLVQLQQYPVWVDMPMLEKINFLFIKDILVIDDFEFIRLGNKFARNYYDYHITVSQKRSLKENINYMFGYFKQRVKEGNSKFYFGDTYGEVTWSSENYDSFERLVYVDLCDKSDTELVNLAIVKLKMEDDFVSFKLNKFIVMMFDYNLISIDEYNLYIYGTTNQQRIDLTKIGLSVSLITRLEKDDQLKYIYFDDYNNLKYMPEFVQYKSTANDFYRFEIDRFLN